MLRIARACGTKPAPEIACAGLLRADSRQVCNLWRTSWRHSSSAAAAEEKRPAASQSAKWPANALIDPLPEWWTSGRRRSPQEPGRRAYNLAKRAEYLARLEGALKAGNVLGIEKHYYAFVEQHRILTGGSPSVVPAVLHLSLRQLNRMLSIWSAPPQWHDKARDEGDRHRVERKHERGSKVAAERCMNLLQQIREAVNARTSLRDDPLDIGGKSRNLLTDLLLSPHTGPLERTSQRSRSSPEPELLLDRILRLLTTRSRTISTLHLRDALNVIRMVNPSVRHGSSAAFPSPRIGEARKPFQQRSSATTYTLMIEALAHATPRHHIDQAPVPQETKWRHDAVIAMLRASPRKEERGDSLDSSETTGNETAEGEDRLQTVATDAFDTLEDLISSTTRMHPREVQLRRNGDESAIWTANQSLSALSAVWHDLRNKEIQAKVNAAKGRTAFSRMLGPSAYGALVVFGLRSNTPSVIPFVMARAAKRGQADVRLFNTLLASLKYRRPKQLDEGDAEEELVDPEGASEQASAGRLAQATASEDSIYEDFDVERHILGGTDVQITRLIYEAMRDNIIAAEMEVWQQRLAPQRRRKAREKYGDLDDPLSAIVAAGGDPNAELKLHSSSARLGTGESTSTFQSQATPAAQLTPFQRRLRAVTGIDKLPRGVVPDAETYSLVIKSLSWHGDLQGAMNVLEDMVQTPLDAGRGAPDQQDTNDFFDSSSADIHETGETFLPGLDIYDSLFRGFARLGVPARLDFLNEFAPSESTWHIDEEEGHGLADWNIKSFCGIFESFLQLPPRDPHRLQSENQLLDPYKATSAAYEDGDHFYQATHPAEIGSIAPSPDQFFWLLTALRRVSGDHARWTLRQWSRAWTKFSPRVDWYDLALEKANDRQSRIDRRPKMSRVLLLRDSLKLHQQVWGRGPKPSPKTVVALRNVRESQSIENIKLQTLNARLPNFASPSHEGGAAASPEPEPWIMAMISPRLVRVLLYLRRQL